MNLLREWIGDERVHIMDGAMGTLLYERGVFVNVCYDELSISEPDLIRGVHEEYVRAGAEILETNTFGANPVKLSAFGLDTRTEEINAAAVACAREAARGAAAVIGAIGPLGVRIEPWGPTSYEEAVGYFRRQVVGLLEGGVDGILFETFADLDELRAAIEAARAETDLPVIAQMTVDEDGRTPLGTPTATLAAALEDWKVDVAGLNCSVGPAVMLDAIEEMADIVTMPLSAQPNAGVPRTVRDRKIYMASPEYMGRYARRLIEAGARFVGGCCGTTPEHIRRIRDSVAAMQPRGAHVQVALPAPSASAAPVLATPIEERSRLGRKLIRREWITSVEIVPPKGWDPSAMLERARQAYLAGVDAVAVLDARGHGRMGGIASALVLQREVGIEPIVHYTCRDRNMLGMISDLLGAAGAGLRNLLVTTGDPSAMGPYAEASAVFDIDSIGLTNVLSALNRGVDPGGASIGEPTRFVIGIVARPAAIDPEREVERFAYKVEAGAEYALTQAVFDPERLVSFLDRTARWRIPTLAAVRPLLSVRDAEFLHNEVPGIVIPDDVIERMRRAETQGASHAIEEGVRIAVETAVALHDRVQGLHVSAPSGRHDLALRVLDEVRVERG
ncbi:MAG: bifunctional homocysteine S-methyltransferase/methylenetetrahydrofolate reductase [Gemmatimonadota bacterium]